MKTASVLSADSLVGTDVYNSDDEKLGTIKAIMIDTEHGRIAYAVLSFGGIMGLGDKLFALPWSSLKCDCDDERFVLDVSKAQLENSDGFDKDDWPDFADATFRQRTYDTYGQKPYWV
jgi:sporulation protein YlmC with PRC-barrel domain